MITEKPLKPPQSGGIHMIDNVFIFVAFMTNNIFGKREDVHGRKYRDVYKRFGHRAMLYDYRNGNSWRV